MNFQELKKMNYIDFLVSVYSEGYIMAQITFVPAWDESKFGNLKISDNNKAILKTPKVSEFDLIKEGYEVFQLMNNKDVDSFKFFKHKTA